MAAVVVVDDGILCGHHAGDVHCSVIRKDEKRMGISEMGKQKQNFSLLCFCHHKDVYVYVLVLYTFYYVYSQLDNN